MGCGVASVASVLKIPYQLCLAAFGQAGVRGDDRSLGFSRRALLTVLANHQQRFEMHTFSAVPPSCRFALAKQLPVDSIVYVFDADSWNRGHYLVRHTGGWMDPFATGHPWRRTLPCTPLSYLLPVTN